MPPVVRTRARDRRDAGNDGAAGHPAPERGESDVSSSSSSLQSFASDEAAAAGDQPGGKQLHNLRRQRARAKRYVESSVATAADTSDEEWSPRGEGKKKQQRKKWGGGTKRGGGGRKKKARRVGPQVSHSVETVASDERLVISSPHAHDVLSGRGGGKQRKIPTLIVYLAMVCMPYYLSLFRLCSHLLFTLLHYPYIIYNLQTQVSTPTRVIKSSETGFGSGRNPTRWAGTRATRPGSAKRYTTLSFCRTHRAAS